MFHLPSNFPPELDRIHVLVGALAAGLAAVMLYVMLGTAKQQTQFWHISTWVCAGLFLIAAGVFLMAPIYRYPPLVGEWAFDIAAFSRILLEGLNFWLTVDTPAADTKDGILLVSNIRRRALRTLLVGVGLVIFIVFLYAFYQNRYTSTPAQTQVVVQQQSKQTRALIATGFDRILERLDALDSSQREDHKIIIVTEKRSIETEGRSRKNQSDIHDLGQSFRRWSQLALDAIERTRKSIFIPPPPEPTPPRPAPKRRIGQVTVPPAQESSPITYRQP